MIKVKELFEARNMHRTRSAPNWSRVEINPSEKAWGATISYAEMREYRFRLEIGRSIICRAEDFNICKDNALRLMQEELYGEMRPMLYELRDAIYREDSADCNVIIQTIENTMFEK
jgi:hypothetical protein